MASSDQGKLAEVTSTQLAHLIAAIVIGRPPAEHPPVRLALGDEELGDG